MTTTEQIDSPTAASSRSGSSRRRHSLGTRGGGGSEAGVIGVDALIGGTAISVGDGPRPEAVVAQVKPLRQDEPGGGGRGLGAEAAPLHGHDHDDGPGGMR